MKEELEKNIVDHQKADAVYNQAIALYKEKKLEQCCIFLLAAREMNHRQAKRFLGKLADSPDAEIRNVVERAFLARSSTGEMELSKIPSDVSVYKIPSCFTSIGDSTFENCSSLAKIVIPDSVETIGDFAFSGCSSLTEVVIPDSVKSIGYSAFEDCSNLI